MPEHAITEREIVEALRHLPASRWGQVLDFIRSLQDQQPGGRSPQEPVATAADLAASGLVGFWADRTDLGDSRDFARRLREQAEHRERAADAPGH
jgi:hypothetical protein